MKTFKQYLLESLLDDEDDLASNDIPLIEEFLKKNYKLHGSYNIREEDGRYFVDVNGDVLIENYHMDQLTSPIFSFGVVKGEFNCENGDIKTLEGAPQKCKEFYCNNCEKLESLKGAPQYVENGVFFDGCIKLKTLEGAPKKCGGIVCAYCSALKTLEGAPQECITFNCNNCGLLKDLKGAPQECTTFNCSGCGLLKDLKGAPKKCKYFSCNNCVNLKSLKGGPMNAETFEYNNCPNLVDYNGLQK